MGFIWLMQLINYTPAPRRGRGVYCFTSVRLSFCPSVLPSIQDSFRHFFLSNYWWQKSDIWSQASYRYPISWEAFLDPSDSYFLFAEERGYHKWALAQFILFLLIKNRCIWFVFLCSPNFICIPVLWTILVFQYCGRQSQLIQTIFLAINLSLYGSRFIFKG